MENTNQLMDDFNTLISDYMIGRSNNGDLSIVEFLMEEEIYKSDENYKFYERIVQRIPLTKRSDNLKNFMNAWEDNFL